MRRSMIMGLGWLLAACTGAGIDRSDAVTARATLTIRPVVDHDPYLERLAATAQGTLPPEAVPPEPVEATIEARYSPRLPPVDVQWLRADSKESLAALVDRAGPVPAGLATAYEHEGRPLEGRPPWSLLVLRDDEGLVLGSETRVKMAWASDPTLPDGVYLLLSPEDGKAFERLTIEHEGRRLAILAGEEVLMAPTVQEPIGGGQLLLSPGTQGSGAALYEQLTGTPPPAATP